MNLLLRLTLLLAVVSYVYSTDAVNRTGEKVFDEWSPCPATCGGPGSHWKSRKGYKCVNADCSRRVKRTQMKHCAVNYCPKPITCPALPANLQGSWDNSDCTSAEVPLNTTCRLSCDHGHAITPADANNVTCQQDGNSTSGKFGPEPMPTCEPITCPALTDDPNGTWDNPPVCTSPDVPLSTTCQLTCDSGYGITSADGRVTCRQDGSSASAKFSPEPQPTCVSPVIPENLQDPGIETAVTAGKIVDFAVLNGKLLASKAGTDQIVEISLTDGSEIEALYDLLQGTPTGGPTVTHDGDLYVSTTEALIRISAGQQTVVNGAEYDDCEASADGNMVYGLRVVNGQKVMIDVVIKGEINHTVETEITHQDYQMTAGATWESDVLFIADSNRNEIHKVSLISGETVTTYGQYGTSQTPGDMWGPYIRFSDAANRQLLINENANQRLQVLNTLNGQFTILEELSSMPWAAEVVGDKVYTSVMSGGFKVKIFEKQN